MSALRTTFLGLSSHSGDNNHGNIRNVTVRIFVTAVTITTLGDFTGRNGSIFASTVSKRFGF